MKKTDALKSLSDDELLCQLADVLAQSRHDESVLVAHIAEVDVRRLYAREASPSMFQYCVDVLHLSKSEAYHRIGAARASREHPVLLTMLEDGRLHLSGISVLAPHLTDANCNDLMTRATHKTKFQIKELVAAIAPKQDAPPGDTQGSCAEGETRVKACERNSPGSSAGDARQAARDRAVGAGAVPSSIHRERRAPR